MGDHTLWRSRMSDDHRNDNRNDHCDGFDHVELRRSTSSSWSHGLTVRDERGYGTNDVLVDLKRRVDGPNRRGERLDALVLVPYRCLAQLRPSRRRCPTGFRSDERERARLSALPGIPVPDAFLCSSGIFSFLVSPLLLLLCSLALMVKRPCRDLYLKPSYEFLLLARVLFHCKYL